MDITIKQAAEFLMERDDFLIISHSGPDADTIGSATALTAGLRSIGKKAAAVCDEPIPKKLSFLDTENCFTDTVPSGIKTYISVDVASASMLGSFEQEYAVDRIFDLSIDHHMVNTIPCERRLIRSDYSSCGEIIFELLVQLGVKIDKSISVPLYGAISSDSGGFRFSSTRGDTMRHAADLIDTGINFAKINRLLFETKSPVQIEIEKTAYNSIELFYGGRLAVVTISAEDIAKAKAEDSDIDSINQIPRQIAGVEVSAVIRPKGDKVKVSLRSNEYFNVAELAASFGGGGHLHAAGCAFTDDVENVKNIIVSSLNGKL